MELSLNPVRPKVRFDGEEFLFESLLLEQKMNFIMMVVPFSSVHRMIRGQKTFMSIRI